MDKVATSALPSWGSPTLSWGPQRLGRGQNLETATWVTCGQSGSIIPTVLGVSNAPREDKNQKWLCCPHVGNVATSPLLSWGSPTLSWGPQRLARGQSLETATWVTCGQNGYITPAVLGVPNAQRGANNQKWLCGPHVGKVAPSPLPSWGSPTLSARPKIRNGYMAHMWAKWLYHPCYRGGPQRCLGVRNA